MRTHPRPWTYGRGRGEGVPIIDASGEEIAIATEPDLIHLFIAAPDLLEAARKTVKELDYLIVQFDGHPLAVRALRFLRGYNTLAIRKAEGATP